MVLCRKRDASETDQNSTVSENKSAAKPRTQAARRAAESPFLVQPPHTGRAPDGNQSSGDKMRTTPSLTGQKAEFPNTRQKNKILLV